MTNETRDITDTTDLSAEEAVAELEKVASQDEVDFGDDLDSLKESLGKVYGKADKDDGDKSVTHLDLAVANRSEKDVTVGETRYAVLRHGINRHNRRRLVAQFSPKSPKPRHGKIKRLKRRRGL